MINWLTLIGQGLGGLVNIAQKLFNLIWNGKDAWFTIDDTVKKTSRSMGLCKEQADGIRKVLIQSQIDLGAVYGMTMTEINNQMSAFNEATNRSNVISADVIKNFGIMSQLLGDNGKAVGKMSTELNDLGGNIRNADAYLGKAFKQASKYGLNASKSASKMAENMKHMSAMRFRNGVSDLTKMSLLTDKMNIDFGQMANAVSKFDTLEGAIQNSAQIAMMGGNLGESFSNPLAMMSMAQNDNAAFMENIMDSVKGLATWDNKNHMASLDWMSQQKIKAMSQATGIGEDELRKISMQSARENQMSAQLGSATMSKLKNAGLDEYVKTLGYQDTDGKWKIDNPDGGRALDIKTLLQNNNAEELKEIFKHVPTDDINKNVGVIEEDVQKIRNFLDNDLKQMISVKEHVSGGLSSVAGGINAMLGETAGNWITNSVNGLVEQSGQGGGTLDLLDNLYKKTVDMFPSWMVPDSILEWKPSSIVKGTLGIEGHAKGGIVGGNSPTGDRVLAGLNSGEMVLNPSQQANLFAVANGAFSQVKGNIQEGIGSALNVTAHYANYKSTGGVGVAKAMRNVFNDFMTNQRTVFREFATNQKNAFADFKQTSKTFKTFSDAKNAHYVTSKNGRDLLMGKKGFIKNNFLNKTVAKSKQTVESIKNFAQNNKLVNFVKDTKNTITSKVSNLKDGITNFTKNNKVTQFANRIKNTVQSSKTVTFVKDSINNAKGLVNKAIVKPIQTVGKVMVKPIQAVGKVIAHPLQSTKSVLGKVGGTISSKVMNSSVGKFVGSKLATSVGGKVAKTVLKKVPVVGTLISAAGGIMDAVGASNVFDGKKQIIEARQDLSKSQKKQMIREAEDERNGKYGSAIGGTIGTAAGAALGSLLGPIGTVVGGMAGEWLGNKVGGFIGKNVNKTKDFLFGKDAEKSEIDEKQDEYETTKFGIASISDSDIKEKAALATVKMHDILVSIYHHMNGKASNGEEESKGLVGNMAETVTDVVTMPMKITSSIVSAGMNLITSPIKSLATVGQKTFIKETSEEKTNNNTVNGDINLNINGSIKLEIPNVGIPNNFNLDVSSLINTPAFRTQIMDIIKDEFVRMNGQKLRDSRMGTKGNNFI